MKKSDWVYLSHFYNNFTPGFGGKSNFKMSHEKCIETGDSCNQLTLKMSNHIGTHIDLPFHFDKEGSNLNAYSPGEWVFNSIEIKYIEILENELILPSHISQLNQSTEVLLIKTNFEKFRSTSTYWESNPGLSSELGTHLKMTYPKLKVIGLDFISASAYQNRIEGRAAHHSFLGKNNGAPILIIEDMKLEKITPSHTIKTLIVAPLLLENADGAPVTLFAEINHSSQGPNNYAK